MRLPLSWCAIPLELNGRKYIDIAAVNTASKYVWLWRVTEEQAYDFQKFGPVGFWDMVAQITKRHEEHACAAH